MNRSLKLSMLVALALGSTQALALDLGHIQVKSALGQPLLAEIPLHPATPAELKNLTVQLASSEQFARAGIVGGRTTIPLHFAVVNAGDGQKVIRITTSEAVSDPYIDLLLEVNGRAGTSVREFAILLDPPGTEPAAPVAAPPAPVASRNPMHRAAPSERAAPAAPSMPPPRRSQPAAAAPAAMPATAGNGQIDPVKRGQTLTSIAHDTAPAGVDISQMLVALKQANPDAFYRDNINALKTGAVLRVPSASEANAMAVAAAIAEVRRQNSDWRAGSVGKPANVADAATRAGASSSPSTAAAGTADRLALVPPSQGGSPTAGGNGKGDKAAASLRQDLLRTQESVASLQQQSTDLKTRLKDLADINSKNEHLLSLKDSEIAQLQAQLAAARKSAAGPSASVAAPAPANSVAKAALTPAPAASVASTPAVAASSASSAMAPTSAATAGAPAKTAASTAPAPAASVKPAASKPAAKPAPARAVSTPVAEEPWYMQTWAWAAGAGAVVILLLLALLGRRRQAAGPATAKAAPSLADRFGSASGAEPEDIDQEELLDQLAEHPDDIGLHLELVTLYYSRRDVEHFEAAAEAMHAHISDPQQDEWQDVLHMGEDLVPGHPLFDHHTPLAAHDESEARRAFDIDDYAAASDAPTVVSSLPPAAQPPKKVSEYNFNFDLTSAAAHAAEPDRTVAPPALAEPPVPPAQPAVEPVVEPDWQAAATHAEAPAEIHPNELGEFSDDPIDTKLDLARAYVDMGDHDGARAMLGEVLKEGSQMQRDVARRLLDSLH